MHACVSRYPTRNDKSRNLIVARRNSDYAASLLCQRKDAWRKMILRALAVVICFLFVCLLFDRANLPWKLNVRQKLPVNAILRAKTPRAKIRLKFLIYGIWIGYLKNLLILGRVRSGARAERTRVSSRSFDVHLGSFASPSPFPLRSRLKRKNDRFLLLTR